MKLIKDFNLTITFSRTFHRNKTKWKIKPRWKNEKLYSKEQENGGGKRLMAQRLIILALEQPQRAKDPERENYLT